MAKRRHEQEQAASSKTAMTLLVIGGLAVAALVVWALTRTVQPAPAASVLATDTAPVTVNPTGTAAPFPTVTPTVTGPTTTAGTTATMAPPQNPAADENASVARTSVADLRSQVESKRVTVIDVRDKTSFMGSHIPGSLSVPVQQLESQVSFLPKDKPIVTYCT